jgi:ATP-dependent DNA helicase RecQ
MSATQLQPETLPNLLHRVFGHRDFRPHQQQVCEAAAAGRDVLLVMPTGAGKSLCYQLPALARRAANDMGTALVISPLIALMDDQAAKLTALGLRVARIHSGRDREESRQACRDYLAGTLDFLFIAPERMRVPGFPEMLAKRKPTLVAIDEAHCISAWGHDFRPDYRTLGQHLPQLRPAPIIALTATATPTVQRDILHQLALADPAVFITGFRRSNLSLEAVELSKPQRPDFALKLLKDPSARPAIIYAQSRKDAEEFASKLHKHFPTAAYHAGLDATTRDRVQRAFLSGKLDVVVATVAFGMGVDKADVRTVIHVALPGSVEAYYQEIGRAGRDGLPSRTVLLHGFADRRLQEFFLEKNYPPITDLERVAAILPPEFTPVDVLHNALLKAKQAIDRETLDRTLEKLLVAGVLDMDIQGDVRRTPNQHSSFEANRNSSLEGDGNSSLEGDRNSSFEGDGLQAVHSGQQKDGGFSPGGTEPTPWQSTYASQIANRRAQIDRMVAFAESTTCRMAALIQHFGDTTDTHPTCGLCDICNPSGNSASAAHQPTPEERTWLRTILRALESRSTSTGKLFTDLHLTKDRNDFDTLLDALARAALITLTNDTFRTPEGIDRTYKKAAITHEGRLTGNDATDDATLDTVWIRGSLSAAPSSKTRKSPGAPSVKVSSSRVGSHDAGPINPAAEALFQSLRNWRTETARPTKTPAFMILADAVLRAIANHNPQNLTALHAVPGMGPAKVDRYGAAILAVTRGDAPPPTSKPAPSATTAPERQPRGDASERQRRDSSQPGAQPQEYAGIENQRAEGPTHRPATERPGAPSVTGTPLRVGSHDPRPTSAVRQNKPTPPPAPPAADLTPTQLALESRLKDWRREAARTAGLPSFFIVSDTVLAQLVRTPPTTLADLRQLRGLDPAKLETYGPTLLTLCRP